MRLRPERTARGATLIEVAVALLIAGLLTLQARQLWIGILEMADRVEAAADAGDREANGTQELRLILDQVTMSEDDEPALSGDERELRARSWCRSARGWPEPCDVLLALHADRDSSFVSAVLRSTTDADSLAGWRGPGAARLLYLVSAQGGGSWSHRWTERAHRPLAVAIAWERDTVILRVAGGR